MVDNQEFINDLRKQFKDSVCDSIEVIQQGINRFVVETPFAFEDGDSYVIVMIKKRNSWVLTDEGHTLMHLSYWMEDIDDLASGNRNDILLGVLASHSMNLTETGEIEIEILENDYGNALFTFIQGITNIMDLTFLSRERVKSTFLEDFYKFMIGNIPRERLIVNWNEPEIDRDSKYVVPYYISGLREPTLVFPIDNENRVKDANITLLYFQTRKFKNHSVVVFEDMGELSKDPVARLIDVGEKPFSNFESNKENIKEHLLRDL